MFACAQVAQQFGAHVVMLIIRPALFDLAYVPTWVQVRSAVGSRPDQAHSAPDRSRGPPSSFCMLVIDAVHLGTNDWEFHLGAWTHHAGEAANIHVNGRMLTVESGGRIACICNNVIDLIDSSAANVLSGTTSGY